MGRESGIIALSFQLTRAESSKLTVNMKNIILLGSTGSVGRTVLDVVRQYPKRFSLKGLSANDNVSCLIEQAEEFKPDFAAIANKKRYSEVRERLTRKIKVLAGTEGLEQLAQESGADIIFIAVSGTSALRPLVAALSNGRRVALASKEPVVSAGMIIRQLMEKYSSSILPVDSEHSAIMQCLSARNSDSVRTIYITGSGGPLWGKKEEDFDSFLIEEILDHPKWKMGPKITVDSATFMNKGLEVIEARWLFDIPPAKIKVIIHPEAIVHSMVEFIDGTIQASLFYPDMKFPVLYALSFPEVFDNDFLRVDFSVFKNISFCQLDIKKFPAVDMAFRVLETGGTLPAALNAANEIAVKLFLDGRIKFSRIIRIVESVVEKHKTINNPSLQDIYQTETWAKEEVLRFC